MRVFQSGNNGTPVKIWADDVNFKDEDVYSYDKVLVEKQAFEQLMNISDLPFIFKHIAVMPDCHLGKGATVGSVIATKKAIIPAAVGVDIGCGMCAAKTTLKASDLPDDLKSLRHQIERDIPVGDGKHKEDRLPKMVEELWNFDSNLVIKLCDIGQKHPNIITKNPHTQLGTLGGGNHFIEICLDEEQNVWVMLHSGSRGIGNKIGNYFIEKAKEEMERFFINLRDKDLAYLPEGSAYFDDYVEAVFWAQQYARSNRDVMMHLVLESLKRFTKPFEIVDRAINCHHNYVEIEHHFGENVFVTRKGAVRARVGDLGIIPGSMGSKSFIVKGKGNPESFNSCSHGAGRVMSRNKAKQLFTVDDHIKATEGVECKKDLSVIDEIPMAYKPIDKVIESQLDLIEVVTTLKQVLCVKG